MALGNQCGQEERGPHARTTPGLGEGPMEMERWEWGGPPRSGSGTAPFTSKLLPFSLHCTCCLGDTTFPTFSKYQSQGLCQGECLHGKEGE